MSVFIILFTVAKLWNQPSCSTEGEGRDKKYVLYRPMTFPFSLVILFILIIPIPHLIPLNPSGFSPPSSQLCLFLLLKLVPQMLENICQISVAHMYIGVRLATGHGLHPWRKSILLQQSSSHWLPVASWLRAGACKPFPHQAEILTSGVWNRSCEGIYSCKEFTVQCSCPFQRILPHGSPQRPLDLTISPPLLLQCSLSLEGKGYTEDICSAIKRMTLYTWLRMDTARGDFKWNIPIQKDKYEIFSNICGTHIFLSKHKKTYKIWHKSRRETEGRKATSRKWGNMDGGVYGHDVLKEIIFMKLNPMCAESIFFKVEIQGIWAPW